MDVGSRSVGHRSAPPQGCRYRAQVEVLEGRLLLALAIGEVPVPAFPSSDFRGLTSGPDGNGWYTRYVLDSPDHGRLGRVTPQGTVTEFTIPGSGTPEEIIAGPDDRLWFTELGANRIGRVFLDAVDDGSLAAAASPLAATEGQDFAGTVARFTDTHPGAVAGNFLAQIDWGDGAVGARGPRISGATLDPVAGTVRINFADGVGLDPRSLAALSRYSVQKVVGRVAVPIAIRKVTVSGGGRGVVLDLGTRRASGRYDLRVVSAGVRDLAGNALDGEFRGRFATGNGRPGGDFLGRFAVRGNRLTVPTPA